MNQEPAGQIIMMTLTMLFPQPENRNVSFPGKSAFKPWTLSSCFLAVDLFRKKSWPPQVYLQKLCLWDSLPLLSFQINLSCSSGVFSWFLVFSLCLGVLRLAILICPLESKKYLRKGFFFFCFLLFVIVVFYSHSKNTKGMFSSFLEMKLIFSALNIWDYGQAFCNSGV